MSVHHADEIRSGLPPEPRLLKEVTVRLIEESERAEFDEQMLREHYLKNATAVGQVLRYVAEYQGRWVALLVFSSAAFHLKPRDRWLHWPARLVAERRHLIAQNSRFLVLAGTGHWPNLASHVLKLVCDPLAADWQRHFGHPVLAVETFVDPQRFKGTCYRAAGWERLGRTQGCQRDWQDYDTETLHPKEIWVRPLIPEALKELRATSLPAHLAPHQKLLPPPCPVVTERLHSLWQRFRDQLTDPRKAKGIRYELAGVLSIMALAVCAGCKGPHAIAEFAGSLSHAQRRQLHCRRRPNTRLECDVPGERTFRRLLNAIPVEELKDVLVAWMAQEDPVPVKVIHLDGKVVKNADPAPAMEKPPTVEIEIPKEEQKPKADKALTLVNFLTSKQRLIDQIAVPQNTNEEASVAAHWQKLDLVGLIVTADAAHTTKANARTLTQRAGADYLFALKRNQPLAYAKAQQLLTGSVPPQAQTIDKGHGRIENRQLWCCPVEPQTLGIAGAAQLIRVKRVVDTMRKGKVIKHTEEVVFFVTSLWPEEASPEELLALIRDHWSIENGQHHRRDRTQDEDRCMVREVNSARVMSLLRSLAIFLHEGQRYKKRGKKSLPDFERKVCRNPGSTIHRFLSFAA